ncbi:MAG: GxxExxY protein [bacterium]
MPQRHGGHKGQSKCNDLGRNGRELNALTEIIIGDFRVDILVEEQVIVELKSVERFDPLFEAQILSYMKLGGYKIGLLINFNSRLLKNGIRRFIL